MSNRLPPVLSGWLLALETTTESGSAALLRDGQAMSQRRLEPGAYSMQLIPAIEAMLAEAGLQRQEIAAVAVAHGPGSFTGVRVGMTLAKGLGEATGMPVLAVSTLAALARPETTPAIPPPVIAVLDASRGEAYCGLYPHGPVRHEIARRAALKKTPAETAAETGVEILAPLENLPARWRALGWPETAPVLAWPAGFAAALRARLQPRPVEAQAQDLAVQVGQLALAIWRDTAEERRQGDDVLALDANYIRRSDAEIISLPGLLSL